MDTEAFKSLFTYDSSKVGYVGVERECFIQDCDRMGVVVPKAHEILSRIEPRGVPEYRPYGNIWLGIDFGVSTVWHPVKRDEFSYELSACQIESRIGPCQLEELRDELILVDSHLRFLLGQEYKPLHTEVGPEDMPLDVYPDPTGRYQRITKHMLREILLAACRVIGTHIHIGMRDHDMALRVYNYVSRHFAELCEMGNGSFGERLAIYRKMAPDFEPTPYASWDEYHRTAVAKGFAEDPRKCWTLIRISVHGTIEFRMFGATDSIERIVSWARYCHRLCQSALISS